MGLEKIEILEPGAEFYASQIGYYGIFYPTGDLITTETDCLIVRSHWSSAKHNGVEVVPYIAPLNFVKAHGASFRTIWLRNDT